MSPLKFLGPAAVVGALACALGLPVSAQPLTLGAKPVKLTESQYTSLKRFLADALPQQSFDWKSLEASANSIGRERQPLTATLSTVPAMSSANVCRSEKHNFSRDSKSGRWHVNEGLTAYRAWVPRAGDCGSPAAAYAVNPALTDAEFLHLARVHEDLRGRAAGVIGGSDCARVRYCEVALQRIERQRQESPSRMLTKLTYFPSKPGPSCLYVMEVTFVGSLEDLVPLGASCPKP